MLKKKLNIISLLYLKTQSIFRFLDKDKVLVLTVIVAIIP